MKVNTYAISLMGNFFDIGNKSIPSRWENLPTLVLVDLNIIHWFGANFK